MAGSSRIAEPGLKRHGIGIAGGSVLPTPVDCKPSPGMEGSIRCCFGMPKNPADAWLVADRCKSFDCFTTGGTVAVEPLKKTTRGDTATDKLIPAIESMSL